MSTTTNALTGRKPTQAEVKFMNSLEEIFKGKEFNARVYPINENNIWKARVSTNNVLSMTQLESLIDLSENWNKKIEIGRNCTGLKINFL